ncbi:alpha/beta hydrolase family protein [Corynebacterium variabile]|uniref:alpha/beta hydrolase family protein n=1 Tax=Corynebacterium variabile TaxID=1727 RepID=UPI003F92A16F
MTSTDTVTLTAGNGEPIAVTRFAPDGQPRGAALISPAMATKASYYTAVATWLADRDIVAYTFDYQGYGASARTPLKDVGADILTWAADAATVVDHVHEDLAEHFGGVPLTWIGHSLGCQLLPFSDHSKITRAVISCGGTGWWKNADYPDKAIAPLLWWALAPALVKVFGYYPGKRIRLLGDIPGPVMTQWARWCRNPDYLFGVLPEHRTTYAAVTMPVTALTFTDDATMSAKASAHLESFYTGAELTPKRFAPSEVGREKVGHMGLYRRGNEDLWEKLLLPEVATV